VAALPPVCFCFFVYVTVGRHFALQSRLLPSRSGGGSWRGGCSGGDDGNVWYAQLFIS